MRLGEAIEEAKKICEKTSSPIKKGETGILVTGLTGFLGSHILEELDKRNFQEEIFFTTWTGFKGAERGKKLWKTTTNLDNLKLNPILIKGKELEGIENCPPVRGVWHIAGEISLAKSYLALKSSNSISNARVAVAEGGGGGPDTTVASTLSVVVNTDGPKGEVKEESLMSKKKNIEIFGGYAQSKTVGELVAEKRRCKIVRFGLLTGSRREKEFNQRDLFYVFRKAVK